MVLRKISAALTASFRLEDCICRIGGDEFVVLMRQVDSTLKYVVRDKIRMVQEKLMMKDDLPPATLSIGVAFSDDKGIGEGEDNLFNRADKALYSIKEHGRDGYAFYGDM
jgi:diguanylate cyclase (GGDEF)-like protein